METLDHQPYSSDQTRLSSVIILGGGLAGMSAAWRLTARGFKVILIEQRPYLGGRAYSYKDKLTGEHLDNGQHIFLGCCNTYKEFLEEIGTLHLTTRQRKLRMEFRNPEGTVGIISAAPLPAPFHLLYSLLRFPFISWGEKLKIFKALTFIAKSKNQCGASLEAINFYEWLSQHGQSLRAIKNFWELIIVPTLNDETKNVATNIAFKVIREALLTNRNGANIGFAQVGLSEIMGNRVKQKLAEQGADLRLGQIARRLLIEKDHILKGVELGDGSMIKGDWYISALPPHQFLDLLPQHLRASPEFSNAARHTWAPIVNIHLWYDRKVAEFEFVSFLNTPIQWIFNRSFIERSGKPGQHLTVSLSNAWEFLALSKKQLHELIADEMHQILPETKKAKLNRLLVLKERKATFRSLPNTAINRLPTTTSLPNLFLAGDWTDTHWPSTMEGAVRSGFRAANLIHIPSGE